MLDKLKANIATIAAIVTSTVGIVTTVITYTAKLATDEELAAHDRNTRSHATTILQRLEVLETSNQRIYDELGFANEGTKHLGARLVRLVTADAETNRAKREQTASYHETLYWQCIERDREDGKRNSIDACVRDAVNAPTYPR